MKKKRISLVLICVLLMTFLAGCGEANKYVYVALRNSTESTSLYLTDFAYSESKANTYIYCEEDVNAVINGMKRDKQNIDVAYFTADEMKYLTKDNNLTVILVDCFDADGNIRGIWVARKGWLSEAPDISKKVIKSFLNSMDYRASHYTEPYSEAYALLKGEQEDIEAAGDTGTSFKKALANLKGMKDIDFVKDEVKYFDEKSGEYKTKKVLKDYEVMEFCAAFAVQNKGQKMTDSGLMDVFAKAECFEMFKDYDSKTGAGYEACRKLYDEYCAGVSGGVPFEEAFDFSLIRKVYEDENK